MASDLVKTLQDLKGRWMIGGSAFDKAPASWRTAAEGDPSPDSALIVLAAQAMQFALQATPSSELQALPSLPQLSLPPPPPQARQQIRNLVRVVKLNESQMQLVIHLLAARGYVVHPADCMPKSFDTLPDVYAPWASWHRAEENANATNTNASNYETINADNWDEWMPAERRIALARLRREQPQAAGDLIAAQVPALPAEERWRIIEILGDNLSSEDQALLEGFAKDRSGKVRKLIAQYLGRINAIEDAEDEVAEYVDFFSVAKKRLSGGYNITANPLKTKAQRKRRGELAAKLNLSSFVRGLGLADEAELINGWKNVDEEASDALVRMVAATGSDVAASSLASRIKSLDGISAEAFQLLFNRLGKESRRDLLPNVLENDDASFSATVVCAQGSWGEIRLEQLKSLRALKGLKQLAAEVDPNKPMRQEMLRQGLFSLGLLADQATASELLKRFTDSGMFISDPMLGLLKLNACLPPGEPL